MENKEKKNFIEKIIYCNGEVKRHLLFCGQLTYVAFGFNTVAVNPISIFRKMLNLLNS